MSQLNQPLSLEEKLRTGAVRRWHIVPMLREQSIAEHMYRVTLITEEILKAIGAFNWSTNITLNAMRLAFIHDQHEVKTGDIPSPAKLRMRAVAGFDVVTAVECDLDREFAQLGEITSISEMVSLADTLEAMDHLALYGAGPRAREVFTTMNLSAKAKIERFAAQWELGQMSTAAVKQIYTTCCLPAVERGWLTPEELK